MGPGGTSGHFGQLAAVSGSEGTKTCGVAWGGAAFNLVTAVSLVAGGTGRADGSPLSVIWCRPGAGGDTPAKGPNTDPDGDHASLSPFRAVKKNPVWWKRWLRKQGRRCHISRVRGRALRGPRTQTRL